MTERADNAGPCLIGVLAVDTRYFGACETICGKQCRSACWFSERDEGYSGAGAYLLRFQYLHSTFVKVFLRVSGVQRSLLQMPMPARFNAQKHWFCKA